MELVPTTLQVSHVSARWDRTLALLSRSLQICDELGQGAKSQMEVREAIRAAKNWLAGVYSDEEISNLGLEEIQKDNGQWLVTVGFSRPWDVNKSFATVLGEKSTLRSFKVVTVDDKSGDVISIRNRD